MEHSISHRTTNLSLSRENLLKTARNYLSRYAASSSQLEKFLDRRIKKLPNFSHEIEKESKILINSIISELQKQKVIDDLLFAEIKIKYYFQRGNPLHIICQKLKKYGVQRTIIETSINNFKKDFVANNSNNNVDLSAAKNYAKRFKLGPHRMKAPNEEKIKKEFAKMARAGFNYETARRTIESEIEL